ncbi:MAG: phosphate/phosphite/phosphonate ABC transporter substrate-binding protein [Calditrichaeota bacterium]|nr:MAG: phosphate/phosphite/phosphonate ABC transporter substrate-binding protein [Calditrichota bacterium]
MGSGGISVSKSLMFLIILLLYFGCSQHHPTDDTPPVEIDFSRKNPRMPYDLETDSIAPLHIAIAAMTSPAENLRYYEELLHYLSQKIQRPVKIEQRKTYKEVNSLLETRQIEMAFVCSGAYVEARRHFPIEILAVPQIRGKSTYNAYIIVHRASSIRRFEDLRGKSFAFTDPLSNTGRLYAVKRVKELGSTPREFFSRIIYTHAHDHSIQAVARHLVDGATVDGLIYDYLETYAPEKVADLRIIEVSEDFGMPPIVVPAQLDPQLKKRLRHIFLHMHEDPAGQKILRQLMIDRFVPAREADYKSIEQNLIFVSR